MVTNVSELAMANNYIASPNNTLLTIETAINASKYPVRECPASKPIFNKTNCSSIPAGEFVFLKNLTCYKPKLASNVSALNLSGQAVSIGIHSLAVMARNISNSVLPLQPCPSKKPLFNGTACIGCPPKQFYDIRSLKCISSRLVSNVKAINATNRSI